MSARMAPDDTQHLCAVDDERDRLIGADSDCERPTRHAHRQAPAPELKRNRRGWSASPALQASAGDPRRLFKRLLAYVSQQHPAALQGALFSSHPLSHSHNPSHQHQHQHQQPRLSNSQHLFSHLDGRGDDLVGRAKSAKDDDSDDEHERARLKVGRPASRLDRLRFMLTSLVFIALILSSGYLLLRLRSLLETQRPASERHPSRAQLDTQLDSQSSSSNWLIATPKCHIPNIAAWHESIAGYVHRSAPLNCSQVAGAHGHPRASLSYARANRLFVSEAAVALGATRGECCLRELARTPDSDDSLQPAELCRPLEPGAHPNGLLAPGELVRVECSPKLANYTNVHSFIVRRPDEEHSLDRLAAKRLAPDEHYSVLMVGVDTISRLNAYRQLNETLGVLFERFGALEFLGYNKVGENTFPNLVPLLTGLRPEQLMETQCWLASNYSQESETGDDYLDDCKYLWNFYQDFGYRTYFSEDWPKASTFNYLKMGFKREPTLFYGRPFTLARDELLLPPVKMGCASCLLDQPLVGLDLENLRNFVGAHQDRAHFAFHWINCPQHDDLNGASKVDRLLADFFSSLRELKSLDRTFVVFFSDHGYRWNDFVSTRVGHYESSLPLMTIAAPKHFRTRHPQLYERLRAHQRALLTPFDLFRTLVDIRNLGAQDSRLSGANYAAGAAPRSRRAPQVAPASPAAAAATTAAPSADITESSGPTASTNIRQLRKLDGLSYRQDFSSLSLLDAHNASQLDRSCIEAGIPDNYCVCHEFAPVADLAASDVLGAAYYLVYVHLHVRLANHAGLCRPPVLERLHQAEVFDFKRMKERSGRSVAGSEDPQAREHRQPAKTTTARPASAPTELQVDERHYLPNREYNIRVSTSPGSALFQEVVRFYGDRMADCRAAVEAARAELSALELPADRYATVRRMNEVCRFSIHSDSISRLNLYKDQSKCVKSNIELKKICYCTDLALT